VICQVPARRCREPHPERGLDAGRSGGVRPDRCQPERRPITISNHATLSSVPCRPRAGSTGRTPEQGRRRASGDRQQRLIALGRSYVRWAVMTRRSPASPSAQPAPNPERQSVLTRMTCSSQSSTGRRRGGLTPSRVPERTSSLGGRARLATLLLDGLVHSTLTGTSTGR